MSEPKKSGGEDEPLSDPKKSGGETEPMTVAKKSGGGNDAYLAAGAKAMVETARFMMDEYAREIFDLWFGGTTPAEVIFDTPRWALYMSEDSGLRKQIREELTAHAERLRPQVDGTPMHTIHGSLNLTFHAEVGSKSGGYRTGYDVLHGSNKSVGDCRIGGTYTATRPGPPGTGYTVVFEGLTVVFNDIVDINKKWTSDLTLGRVAFNMARALGSPPPRDYTVRLRWWPGEQIRVEVRPLTPDSFYPPRRALRDY